MKSVLILFIFPALCSTQKSFVVDYENDRFLKDGKPFQYISGTLHYYQVPHDLWRDRMERARAMGINAIQTYIKWNTHETFQGQYKFDGDANITEYILMAKNLSLLVILRVGPYVCSEQDFGGLPYWLLKYPNISERTSMDKRYTEAVARWFSILLPLVRPLLYINGGPVIMVQFENEYGSFGCDEVYKSWLLTLGAKYLQDQVVYFTTDSSGLDYLKCGRIPNTLATVDFGVADESAINVAFANLRQVMPRGPKVNSEFYPGWYSVWGDSKRSLQPSALVTHTMKLIWRQNASFNIYPIHGGTNWGYQSGSLCPPFRSVTTGYDFDAPISESGDITSKYFDMKATIEQLTGQKVKFPLPRNSTKFNYGKLLVQYVGNVFDLLHTLSATTSIQTSKYPLTMEQLDVPGGFVLYESTLPHAGKLDVGDIHDRAYIFVDYKLINIIQRDSNPRKYHIPVKANSGSLIHILVENQGRIEVGHSGGAKDRKGLISNVTLNNDVITSWTMYPLMLENLYWSNSEISLSKYLKKNQNRLNKDKRNNMYIPSFYLGYLMPDTVGDTFFNSTGWGKGQLIINGLTIGRYWPVKGPQLTLYIPSVYLTGFNQIVLFELDNPGNCRDKFNCHINFVDHPIYMEEPF